MSQFNYGSNLGANTTSSGFAFGAPKPNIPTFGTLGATQPSGSITFGTPIATVAPTNQNASLSTGAPNFGTGLNFGSAAPTFGSPAKTPGLAFGTAATQPAVNFGTSTATPNLSFGTATSTAPGLSFGAPATSGGLPFGTPAANTTFSLGAPTPASTIQNPLAAINFGAPATSSAGGSSFGMTPNPLGGINFGTAASTATTPAPTLNFGTATTAATGGLNFGLGGSITSSAAPTLNFKSTFTPAATTTATLNFGFSTLAKTQAPLTLGTTTTTTQIGLGGVDSTFSKPGTVTTGRTDTIAGKENQVPNEILQSIESFKQFVKDQKTQSSDVSRGSARPFIKVREDIDLTNSILTEVSNDLQKNQQLADKLKHDSAKCLHNAEMAQRTNDTPPGLQFENTAPLQYFIDLVNQFEKELQDLRVQIDITDKHFQSLHEPRNLTSQELANGMRRLHDTFVALAGRLHSVHTRVESQKEQYLNLRRYILKDPTNIFAKPLSKEEHALDMALKGLAANKSISGPTPFSSFGSPFALNVMNAQQTVSKPPPAYPTNTQTPSFGSNPNSSGNSTLGANQSLFGTTAIPGPPQTAETGFQLQSPPIGNKRGKR